MILFRFFKHADRYDNLRDSSRWPRAGQGHSKLTITPDLASTSPFPMLAPWNSSPLLAATLFTLSASAENLAYATVSLLGDPQYAARYAPEAEAKDAMEAVFKDISEILRALGFVLDLELSRI